MRNSLSDRINKLMSKKVKRASLIGLNYPNTPSQLYGCINDANNMSKVLNKKYHYKTKVLTDKDITKNYDVIEILNELIDTGCRTIFFHYSGHGTQQRDLNGDEIDHLDEVLYSKKMITDDQIFKSICRLSPKQTLVMVFDCCHSGTIVDLPYQLKNNRVYYNKNTAKKIKGNVICISGCKDSQVSIDVRANSTAYGALTFELIKLFKGKSLKISWKTLYDKLKKNMEMGKYEQIPQLCVSRKELFDETISM